MTPHAPQFIGSDVVSAQEPEPHIVNPGRHAEPHVPPVHVRETPKVLTMPQLCVQEPQKFGDVDRLTHAPLQFVSGGVHVEAHPPGVHVSPGRQAFEHDPQCDGSARFVSQPVLGS